ncbi:MAG: endonuclease/exonuclease/phosphatase family protein [Deltaproteobacteria bacterium]|nr:endonuclease/exonuclease/phosphatase family protein [Deltaproteobacteria bacterium]
MHTFLARTSGGVVTMRPGLVRTARTAVGFGRALAALTARAEPEGEIPLTGLGGRVIRAGETFRVITWNVQYCAGRTQRFFYDGGTAVRSGRDEVAHTLAGIVALLRRWSPDVVLLQEVDRGADRTGGVDQHSALREGLGLPVAVSAPYHRVGFVPFPPHDHLGRVDMHLSAFSAFQCLRAGWTRLPLLRESWLRQRFNLRRVLLDLDLATAAGPPLRVFNTHLSAFSFGDGSLAEQIARCARAASEAENTHGRWLLSGDFNALPPGDDPSRLGSDAALYPESEAPIRALTERFHSAGTPAPDTRSWVPWGSNTPDRQLDWLFHGSGIVVKDHRVDRRGAEWSDHLPLVTDVALR